MFTREQIEKAVKAKGYKYFENGEFNVNVIGIRNTAPGKKLHCWTSPLDRFAYSKPCLQLLH